MGRPAGQDHAFHLDEYIRALFRVKHRDSFGAHVMPASFVGRKGFDLDGIWLRLASVS